MQAAELWTVEMQKALRLARPRKDFERQAFAVLRRLPYLLVAPTKLYLPLKASRNTRAPGLELANVVQRGGEWREVDLGPSS